jgi:hypothetical protein
MASSTSKHYDDPAPPAKHTEVVSTGETGATGPQRDPMNTLETIAEEQRRRSDEYVAGLAAAPPPEEMRKVAPPEDDEPPRSKKK